MVKKAKTSKRPRSAKAKKPARKKTEKRPVKLVVKKPAPMAEEGDVVVSAKHGKTPSLLRGMRDIMPKDEYFWKRMYHTAEGIAEAYGFERIETPLLEEASLFIRSLGRGTDVIEKEMYVFEDRDGTKVALRPEGTASVARAYISHGLHTAPQPVKVWYWGAMFRHDRPQAGRFREFHQFSCESLGVHEPVVDAELIAVAYNFLLDLGIATHVHVNSIGTAEDRERYVVELVGYLRSKRSYLCQDCLRRMNKNPLRVLDCKEEQCRPIIEEAPQIVDWLGDASKKFFMTALEYLDELDVPYVLRPTLVRGLDYYTDTVFEFYQEDTEQGQQSALGGGGRYNGLVAELGGNPTPGSGFSIGLERVVSALRKMEEASPHQDAGPKIFFAQLGEQARRRALGFIEDLRRHGMRVRHSLGKSSLKAQMELADKFGATHTVILGQKEVQDGTVIIRDMESGIQEIIDQKKLKQEVKKLMEK